MKTVRETASLVGATLVLVFFVALAPVAAEDGAITSGTPPTNNTSGQHHTGDKVPGGGPVTSGVTSDQSSGSSGDTSSGSTGDKPGGSLQGRADELLSQDRKSGHEHTQAQRQQFCSKNQNGINHKMSNLSTHAQTFLDNFNKIFTQVQAFQSSKQLNVSNYDTLVTDVTAKQAAATTAVTALKGVSGSINCSSTDPATAVAGVKTAAGDAKTALQDYRASLKTLIQALLAAKNASDSSTNVQSQTKTGVTSGTSGVTSGTPAGGNQ